MTREELKKYQDQISKMTSAQKKKWLEINEKLIQKISSKDFKTKTAYANAMGKVYEKTMKAYIKTLKK